MNVDKTQIIWIGTRRQLDRVEIGELRLGSALVPLSTQVTDLGVIIDNELTLKAHVSSLCRKCYFELRQLRQIRSSLSPEARKGLVHAMISSRLDYCNSLLYGVSAALLKKLQGVQNAAARFIAGVRRFDHITPVLHDLHWLPVQKRIVFKIATLVYKCMHEMAPSYLARDCVPASSVSAAFGERLRPGVVR